MKPIKLNLRIGVAVVCCVAALFATGCSSDHAGHSNANGIPLGEWKGDGTFVYDCYAKADRKSAEGTDHASRDDGPSFKSGSVNTIVRDYKTSLKLAKAQLDGHDVIEASILSERGEIPDLENRTQLRFAMIPVGSPDQNVQLFRIVALEFNPSPSGPHNYKYDVTDSAPVAASLIQHGEEAVLQVTYAENFADTYRFRGSQVEKNGVYFDPATGLVHWSEYLRP